MPKVVGFDPKLVKRCTCKSCSAIIEYTDNEVCRWVHYDYGGGSDYVYEIICPNCGNKVQWG